MIGVGGLGNQPALSIQPPPNPPGIHQGEGIGSNLGHGLIKSASAVLNLGQKGKKPGDQSLTKRNPPFSIVEIWEVAVMLNVERNIILRLG